MTPLQWIRAVAAFLLIALGAAGLFLPTGYPGLGDETMSGVLAFAFITTGFGTLGIKLPALLANRRNEEQ